MTGAEAVRLVISRIRPPVAKPGLIPGSCANFSQGEYEPLLVALGEAAAQLDESSAVVVKLTKQVCSQAEEIMRLSLELLNKENRQ